MTMTDSFAFGSLISAVDPVATIAIFNALNVDPVLNMLVFGESILNDAVSIVLTNTAEGFTGPDAASVTGWQTFLQALGYFLKMFFGSAALGTLTGLISALCLKHFDLRKTPSLEFGMMIIFAYLPYGLAEGIKLSGIMAILFSGIVMSHYTHHNLSPVTQILMQQTLRTVAFMCETCVFAFLGLSIFSFPHKFEFSFVIWCIVLVLLGRAINIFPLSFLLNFFRDHKITPKMMFIMWFSGLRGAIPYALSLHLGLEPIEKRQLIGTTTIVIVLFTILLMGGGTMPLIRIMDIEDSQSRRRNRKDINLSKTEKMVSIMAILFSGIVMSHYTHHNLSPVTQILMQQTLRTVAFMCETCVFAFLGLSIFSFPHKFEFSFVIWCIVLVLLGRAINIFPLSFLLNFFRDHKITPKMMFIMWFSGLRGAIPYALSLHLGLEPIEKRQLIGTTTIVIVLFTILLMGGGTMPLIRIMDIEDSQSRRRNRKDINLSKTEKMGNTVESEHLSELTEEEYEAQIVQRQDLKGFLWLDAKYLNPFFTRRITQEDLLHGRIQMKTLTNKWYEEVRQGPSGSEDEDDEAELL
ncbi:hypothetical protein PDJAM_G00069500 [Pangasius djambal]|uniref:Uncharacterized protein n=1 Tax=Pangasius djambal TaxID=1691987 RepID=A0ACC5YZZ9_9TELE|nr:hypothetical protein [Pangasius djambal]